MWFGTNNVDSERCRAAAAPQRITCLTQAVYLSNLRNASDIHYIIFVSRKSQPCRRSGCPVNISLEMIGDRWSLLIIRDMMLRGFRTYQEFLNSDEGIATNILADRLRKLANDGIISTSQDPEDRRKLIYKLTQKGMDLAPVLLELVLWSARYEKSDAPRDMIRKMEKNRAAFLAEIRKKWQQDREERA